MCLSSRPIKKGINAKVDGGFALVVTVGVAALLFVVLLGMLSLASFELSAQRTDAHRAQARANARMALMLALGELQKHAGPDQRVTARAAILEAPGGKAMIANRNWLGVWSTTVDSHGKDWPVIGKAPSRGNNDTPYSRPGAYEDLRHTSAQWSGNWRQHLRRTWLVSKSSTEVDVSQALDLSDDGVVAMVGRGTLGAMDPADLTRNRVLVEKVKVESPTGGGYAWYISDNNQKASIEPGAAVDPVDIAFEASPGNHLTFLESLGSMPFERFSEHASRHTGKLLSYPTAALTQQDQIAVRRHLMRHYHDLTHAAEGLFTNTLEGGLRQDLTPLLLANKGNEVVGFSIQQGPVRRTFSSSYPIIAGSNHGVLGPSFGTLRNWAQHTYSDLSEAETQFDSTAVRMRPTEFWPHQISDGACAEASGWAESAPKIHPIMTDVRWHYYFSHRNQRIRTHIIPRVCLWNPYTRALAVPSLSVLMPNPFYQLSSAIHFFPETSHVNELKAKYSDDRAHLFSQWISKGGYVGGSVYKIRINPFPEERFLAFALERTIMQPGECHVFSPKVTGNELSASGVHLQRYQPLDVVANVLSSSVPQGGDHFYYDHGHSVRYQVQAPGWRNLSAEHLQEIDFSRIFDYQPEVSMHVDGKVESFPFVLKSGTPLTLADLYTSIKHPTLQLVNNGGGGVVPTTYFGYDGENWGSANQQDNSFGFLQTFAEAPLKDAPETHQVGAKLLWLDERGAEANNPPLRVGRWTADHMAFNISPIANWNVRAQLVTRSPASQCALKWYMTSTGPWLLQFSPHSPQDINDQPSLSQAGKMIKNPFGATVHFPFAHRVALFDLPSKDYGVLSLARLRHAMLSPYSWHPSYLVGHSLRDLHAPHTHTAHRIAVTNYTGGVTKTRWDYLIGGAKGSGLGHGPYARHIDSQGLLQIGDQGVYREVGDIALSSSNEVLAYDIAYEVNHNLWDRFFLSGIPLHSDTRSFDWETSGKKRLWNRRYQFISHSGTHPLEVKSLLAGPDGLNHAFWRSAEWLQNKAAFNVNSTSVEAWTAFLAGTYGLYRPLQSGEQTSGELSFARYHRPDGVATTSEADLKHSGAWQGGRQLTGEELRKLAGSIVAEVKRRGPFLSVADFVNRRLSDAHDPTSHMGALDAAIQAAELNQGFERRSEFLSTAVNVGTRGDAPDNNHATLQSSYRYRDSNGQYTTVQPHSQGWGLPGFLTQGDILEPLAPAVTVRGDTFTIRAYGESGDNGLIKARAWLEATVTRIPRYVHPASIAGGLGGEGLGGNRPGETGMIIQQATGGYIEGTLNAVNKRFGRRFIIKSFRWLGSSEI